MFALLRQPGPETLVISKAAVVFETTLQLIKAKARRRHKRAIAVTEYLSVEDVERIANWSGCPDPFQPDDCPQGDHSNKYRSIDGVCNNRNNPLWGAANTALARWLPAEYEDGESQPKGWNVGRQYSGFQLPRVREVSKRIMQGSGSSPVPMLEDEEYAQMLVDWGQYIDHDISFTPQSSSISTAFPSLQDCLSTCDNTGPCFPIESSLIPGDDIPPDCFSDTGFASPICRLDLKIPPEDQLFGRKRCLPFFRSSPACLSAAEESRSSGPRHRRDLQQMLQRQQTNAVTSFLDASTVYGHSPVLQSLLREPASPAGLLAVNHRFADADGRAFLPSVASNTLSACFQEPSSGGGGEDDNGGGCSSGQSGGDGGDHDGGQSSGESSGGGGGGEDENGGRSHGESGGGGGGYDDGGHSSGESSGGGGENNAGHNNADSSGGGGGGGEDDGGCNSGQSGGDDDNGGCSHGESSGGEGGGDVDSGRSSGHSSGGGDDDGRRSIGESGDGRGGVRRRADRVECFLAGDSRVNEVLPLTALHTLWVREHNRVAATLKALNPQWSAEVTYQESRKIIGALHQASAFS
ncbi:hypothetical protein ACEWY4_005802 [Coilia grayii]|uniref:Thyroid peroxidase n=1 Tax=Coilia grayii TaxID=363190 RepID=A0ABD1KJI2_9TELE